VRDFFHFVDNYIHDIDLMPRAAAELKLGEGENYAAMTGFLESRYGVRVCAAMPATRRSAVTTRSRAS